MAAVKEQLTQIQGQLTAIQNLLAEKTKSATANMSENQKKGAMGAGAAVGLYGLYRVGSCISTCLSRRRRLAEIESFKEDGKVHLYIRPRSPWSPSVAHFCTKVEAFLRLANIEYEVVETSDCTGSPNECLPFIVHNENVVADSRRIIEYLTTEFHVNIDYKLNKTDRATGTALVNMIDYNIGPIYNRIVFIEKPELGATIIQKARKIPYIFARLGVRSTTLSMKANLDVTPASFLTPEQYENEFLRDCEAVEQQIGDKPFLFGDEPTSFDCAVYGAFIPFANMKSYAEVNEAFLTVSQSPILIDYLHRLTERLFPDLEEILAMTAYAKSELAEDDENDSSHIHAEEREGEEPVEVSREAAAGQMEVDTSKFPYLTESDIQDIAEVFHELDTDRSGRLDADEFMDILQHLNKDAEITKESTEEFLTVYGGGQPSISLEGLLNYMQDFGRQFIAHCEEHYPNLSADKRAALVVLFRRFDADLGGSIDANEFQEMASKLGRELTLEQAQEAVSSVSGAETMNLEQFLSYFNQ